MPKKKEVVKTKEKEVVKTKERVYPLIFLLSESGLSALETAAKNYSQGWRAHTVNNLPTVISTSGEIHRSWDNEEYMIAWNALVKYELSVTWKERHAKGVPVKLSLDTKEEYNKRMQWYDLDGELDSHLIDDGSPYVVVFASPVYKKSGSFRNFRYKQSWLDKKGGECV